MALSPDMPAGRTDEGDSRWRVLFELLDGMPFAASVFHLSDLRIAYSNLATVGLLRAEGPHELIGRRFFELVHPDDLERVRTNLGALRANDHTPHDRCYRLLRFDGTSATIEGYATLVEHAGQESVLAILIDVTDREDARRAQEVVERQYRTLVDAAPDGIAVGVDGRFVFANQQFVDMIGVGSHEELLGSPVIDVVAPADQCLIEDARRKFEQGETLVHIRAKMIRADWREFDAEISVVRTEHEGKPASQAFIRDVTAREEALRAQSEAEEFARSILESMPLAVYTFRREPDGVFVFTGANPAARSTIHLPYNEMIGRPYLEAFPWTRGSQIEEAATKVLTSGGQYEFNDYLPRMFSDRPRWFDVRIFGTGPGTAAMTFVDVTRNVVARNEMAARREELERSIQERTAELQDANMRLEQATQAKSSFLTSMSHELRTPLNSIIGFSSVLLQGMAGPLGEEQERQIGMINRAGRQLLALVGDVLDLERIESGRLELQVSEFGVPRFVAQVAESVRPMVEEQGLRLEIDAARAPARMRGDRRRIQQVLDNFLSNAIKYTESGFIRLDVEEREHGMVAFSVSDSGVGVAPEDLDRIFDEFRQLPGAGSKNPGSGLGLSIARHMSSLMNGSVEVESALGKGSTFTLVVPGARHAEQPDAPQRPDETRPGDAEASAAADAG